MAGPTSFAPIIEMAITIVEHSGGQYHVLVIIADGQVEHYLDWKWKYLFIYFNECILKSNNWSSLSTLQRNFFIDGFPVFEGVGGLGLLMLKLKPSLNTQHLW